MAATQIERSAKAVKKRIEYGEKELRHKTRLNTRQKLDELMAWNDIEEIGEAIQNLILNAHAPGPSLSYGVIGSPCHNFPNKRKCGANVSGQEPVGVTHKTGRRALCSGLAASRPTR